MRMRCRPAPVCTYVPVFRASSSSEEADDEDEDDFEALPAPGETSQGTGTDVHEIDEEEITEGNEENDESFLFSDLAEQLGTLGED